MNNRTYSSNQLSLITKYPWLPISEPQEFSTLYRTGLPVVGSRCTPEMTMAWVMADSFSWRRSDLVRVRLMSNVSYRQCGGLHETWWRWVAEKGTNLVFEQGRVHDTLKPLGRLTNITAEEDGKSSLDHLREIMHQRQGSQTQKCEDVTFTTIAFIFSISVFTSGKQGQ